MVYSKLLIEYELGLVGGVDLNFLCKQEKSEVYKSSQFFQINTNNSVNFAVVDIFSQFCYKFGHLYYLLILNQGENMKSVEPQE